jgi:hypothetical protein
MMVEMVNFAKINKNKPAKIRIVNICESKLKLSIENILSKTKTKEDKIKMNFRSIMRI